MNMTDTEKCVICKETKDEYLWHRALSCGHTICTACINNSIVNGYNLECSQCQDKQRISRSTDSKVKSTIDAPTAKVKHTQMRGLTKNNSNSNRHSYTQQRVRELVKVLKYQKDVTRSHLEASNENRSNILESKRGLLERKKEHEEIVSRMQDKRPYYDEKFEKDVITIVDKLISYNLEMMRQIDAANKRLVLLLKEGERCQKEVRNKLTNLEEPTNTDLVAARVELSKICGVLESWNSKCKTQSRYNEIIKSSRKIISKTTVALKLVSGEDNEASESSSQSLDLPESVLSMVNQFKDAKQATSHVNCNEKSSAVDSIGVTGVERITITKDTEIFQVPSNPQTKVVSPTKQSKRSRVSKRRQEATPEEDSEPKKSFQGRLQDKDEYHLFGEWIARKIRNLGTRYARITVQQHINNIIYEAEQGNFDNLPSYYRHSKNS